MNEIISLFFAYGIPIVTILVLVIVMIIGVGFSTSYPRYLMIVIVLIMLVVPSANSYGTIDGNIARISILWVKGSKSFFFPFFDMLLVSTWFFGVFIANHWAKNPAEISSPLSKWYITFGIMLLGYLVVAMFGEKSLLYELGGTGVINVIKQGMFVSILFATIRTERDIKLLFTFILICLTINECWGLFRYFFLGGDPQNIYANLGTSKVKITFVDISDSVLSCLIIGVSVWKLLVEKITDKQKFIYLILGIISLLIPALSARRSGQIGLVFCMILLFLLLPKGRRFPILIVMTIAISIIFASLATRGGDPSKSIVENVLIDVKTGNQIKDPRKTRFYELQTAWKTVKENPVFGVGPSGEFKVDSSVGLEYHGGNYGFVHSGFGHILLKTGFLGLFIFLGIYLTFIINIIKGYRIILPEHKALVVGCLSGFVAFFPTLINGTPIPEIRTMLISGFLFAIPLICISIAKRKIIAIKNDNLNSSNKSPYFSPTIPLVKLEKFNR